MLDIVGAGGSLAAGRIPKWMEEQRVRRDSNDILNTFWTDMHDKFGKMGVEEGIQKSHAGGGHGWVLNPSSSHPVPEQGTQGYARAYELPPLPKNPSGTSIPKEKRLMFLEAPYAPYPTRVVFQALPTTIRDVDWKTTGDAIEAALDAHGREKVREGTIIAVRLSPNGEEARVVETRTTRSAGGTPTAAGAGSAELVPRWPPRR